MPPHSGWVGESGEQTADRCATDALEGVDKQALAAAALSLNGIVYRGQFGLFISQKPQDGLPSGFLHFLGQ